MLLDGTRLGRWHLGRVLGVGGMGTVHLATDGSGREVALKVIRAELAADPLFRSRFQREIRILRSVEGAGIAAVIDADADGAVPWFATEYIAGPTLGEAVERDGALSPDNVHALAVALLQALQRLHRLGVVHRDLKPSNVILTADGPVVIDFGIADAVDSSTSLTGTGTMLGSPGWISPEQVLGNEVTSAADVFGWGAVIAYAATAQPPFGTGRPDALLYRVVHADPDLAAITDHALQAHVRAALSKEPGERPSVAGLLAGLVGSAVPDDATALIDRSWSWTPTAVRSVTRVAVTPRPDPPERSRSRVLRYSWVGAALVLAATLAIGVVALSRGPARVPATSPSTDADATAVSAPTTQPAPITRSAPTTAPPPSTAPAPPSTTAPAQPTPAPVSLDQLRAQPDVVGITGPYSLSDGTRVAVLSRSGVGVLDDGTVELAAERATGWHVERSLSAGIVNAPEPIGDVTGDGVPEIKVMMTAQTAGKGWDVLYRIDADGPTLREVSFDLDALRAMGLDAASLLIGQGAADRVETSVGTCTPSCAEDAGRPVSWKLDRAAGWVMKPEPAPTSDCTSTSLYDDTGVRTDTPQCADGWAAAVQAGCSGECEGSEVFHLEGGRWTSVGYHYAVCAEALAASSGMPLDTAEELAWMSCPETTDSPSSTPLRRGDSGPGVTALQQALADRAYAVDVDGRYGAATEAAVRAFQSDNGFDVDGAAGQTTLAALGLS